MVLDQLRVMARAVEENWRTAWATLGALTDSPRSVVENSPTMLRVFTPEMPESLLNMIIGYHQPRAVTREDVERAIVPYRQHRLPFQWWLMLGEEPKGLRTHLRALGMQSWGGATAMLLPLTGWEPHYRPPVPGVTLDRIRTPDDARDALDIICSVFYVPSYPMSRWTVRNPAFQVYLARCGGQPVASLGILRDGDTVGVYHVATLPAARRRGVAGNLMIAALREARATGCARATLTATPEARHLYERLGFRGCGVMEQWMPGPHLMHELVYAQRTHRAGGYARYDGDTWEESGDW